MNIGHVMKNQLHPPKVVRIAAIAGRAKPSLSIAQRARLRTMLEAKRAQLLRAHEDRARESADAELESVDVADRAEGVIEDRLRAALEEHDRALLEEVDHALAKLDAGTYGVSEMSGRPIPLARLVAVPWARFDSEEAKRIER